METLITDLNSITQGYVVVIGSWGRKLNGFLDDPGDTWINISTTPLYVEQVKSLGTVMCQIGKDNWGEFVQDQFVVKTDQGYRIDTYVNLNLPSYSIINSVKVETPEHDLLWHQTTYNSFQTDYLLNKVNELETLYNL